jgi:hypothetical protein
MTKQGSEAVQLHQPCDHRRAYSGHCPQPDKPTVNSHTTPSPSYSSPWVKTTSTAIPLVQYQLCTLNHKATVELLSPVTKTMANSMPSSHNKTHNAHSTRTPLPPPQKHPTQPRAELLVQQPLGFKHAHLAIQNLTQYTHMHCAQLSDAGAMQPCVATCCLPPCPGRLQASSTTTTGPLQELMTTKTQTYTPCCSCTLQQSC